MSENKPKKSEESLFIKCECHEHLLEVTREQPENCEPFVNVTIWGYGNSDNSLSWGQRLKWAFRILFKGELYGDEIVLDVEKAKQLTNFLRRVVYKKK